MKLNLNLAWSLANLGLLMASPAMGSSKLRGATPQQEDTKRKPSQHRVLERDHRGRPTVVEGHLGKLRGVGVNRSSDK
jgi:hypothetical protein